MAAQILLASLRRLTFLLMGNFDSTECACYVQSAELTGCRLDNWKFCAVEDLITCTTLVFCLLGSTMLICPFGASLKLIYIFQVYSATIATSILTVMQSSVLFWWIIVRRIMVRCLDSKSCDDSRTLRRLAAAFLTSGYTLCNQNILWKTSIDFLETATSFQRMSKL